MPIAESYVPGSFCWVELGATDQQAVKPFYEGLFGWTANDVPMGPEGVYTMYQYKGQTVAAGFTFGAQMKGVPPNWGLYISCENADASAAKCTEHGGKVQMGPFDVGPNGRMAIVSDPLGAVFNVWQGKDTPGLGIIDEPNTFCWADLSCADPETAAKFYSAVFGWQTDAGDDGSGYMHIRNNGKAIGGIPPAKYADPNVPPHWIVYFNVDDVDASTAKAKAAGAAVHHAPCDIPSVGRLAILADPQGAVFNLFKEAPRGQ